MYSEQHAFWFFPLWAEQSLLYCTQKRWIGAPRSSSCQQPPPIPYSSVSSGKRDSPSFTEHPAAPILPVGTQTHGAPPPPPPHPRQPSVISPQPPCHQYRRPLWQIDVAAGSFFFSFFSFSFSRPPPNQTFFFFPQPWHKMVKWCSTAEFNFTVQLGPWLHCQIQINVHLTNMDQGNSGWQPAVIGAIDSYVEFYAPSTPVHHWWNWLIKWIHCYNYL